MKRALSSFASWPVRRFGLTGRTAVVAGPFIWLLLFFLVPFLLVVKISFADLQLGIPPYTELTSFQDGVLHIALDFSHYAFLLTDSLYFATYVNSVVVAAVSTLLCLLLGYPMAYYIARSNPATPQYSDDGGDAAVLDVVPDSRVCVDRHSEEQRLAE